MAGTGKLVITDSYLKDFAQQKIKAFTDAMTTDPAVQRIANYATGVASGASGAVDPSGTFHTLLGGNPSSGMSSAAQIVSNFKTLAGVGSDQTRTLTTNGNQLAADLLNVDNVLTDANDKAAITAPEMTADLQNLSLGGSNGPTNNTHNVPAPNNTNNTNGATSNSNGGSST